MRGESFPGIGSGGAKVLSGHMHAELRPVWRDGSEQAVRGAWGGQWRQPSGCRGPSLAFCFCFEMGSY